MGKKATLTLEGVTTAEELVATVRREAPGMLMDAPKTLTVPAPVIAPRRSGPLGDAEALLTPAEVATMFRVDPKTVTRWAKAGKLTSIRTLGGHRRYRETEVRGLLAGIPQRRGEDA
jgi:excisionase family DNA binding protein